MTETLDLLFDDLATDGAAFILGAGASAPHIPTLGEIPNALAPLAEKLTSFPPGPIEDSPLRRLIEPLIEKAKFANTVEDWLPGAMTSATVAVLMEHQIVRAQWERLPQYEVFRLFPLGSSVVSFNWDGLARVRCPQRCVLHPHGRLPTRTLHSVDLDDLLDYAQLDDSSESRSWLLPGLVMPGEEESEALSAMRGRVLALWETVEVPVFWTSARLKSGRLSREGVTDRGRGSMTVPFNQPLAVVPLDEFTNDLPSFLER